MTRLICLALAAALASHLPIQGQEKKDPPKTFTNSLGMTFVWIKPGSFTMGSPKEEKEREDSEAQHKVTLTKGFYMGVYTVTQEQWAAVMDNLPGKFKGEKNLPVENVSWDDCQKFVKELRAKDKRPYRLPSEAEWEYACRAGTTTPFHFGQTISTDQANYNGNFAYGDGKKGVNREKTVPVGSFPANAWGLHDMSGNVLQWCQDWYGDYPQKDVVDPTGAEKGKERVLRGGSLGTSPDFCRSAARIRFGPGNRGYGIGLRVCFFMDTKEVEGEPKSKTDAGKMKVPPKEFTNSLGMKFVWIKPGTFVMGSPKGEEGRFDDETQHKVRLSKGFYMGVYSVTQEQWKEVMGNNPSTFKGEKNLPVETVSWDDCQEFVKKLREKDKKMYRLPSEAEWEFCCRAGTTTPFHFGQTISTDQANYDGECVKKGVYREKTTPVGTFPANAWGLHDMHGNVWQWCQDWHGGAYPQKDVVDPTGPEKGTGRVLRGGSWHMGPHGCRSACRGWNESGSRFSYNGCRLCFCLD